MSAGSSSTELTMDIQDDNVIHDQYPNMIDNMVTKLKHQCSSPNNVIRTTFSFFPVLEWLPKYSIRENLLLDLFAGLTVGVIHVPMGISYAIMSGVSPIDGLFASFFCTLFYFFFGTSHHTSLGLIALVALITGGLVDSMKETHPDGPNPQIIASTLTFTVGLIQILVGLLRLEFLSTYFSEALVGGFTTGATVHIIFSQIPPLFGIKSAASSGVGNLIKRFVSFSADIGKTNVATLILGVTCIVILVICKYLINPFLKKRCSDKIFIPFDLILIAASTVLSHVSNWETEYKIGIIGTVDPKIPVPTMPDLSIIPECAGSAVGITIISLGLQISVAKMAAKKCKYEIDCGQEVYAVGLTSLLSGFFPTCPSAPGITRTNIALENNQKTLLSSIPTCLLLIFVIFVSGPYLKTMPLCVLAAIIIVALAPSLKNCSKLSELWKMSKYDFLTWLVACIATIGGDIVEGLLAGFFFVLLTVIIRTQSPSWTSEYHITPKNQSVIFKFKGYLLFSNVDIFQIALQKVLHEYERRTGIQVVHLLGVSNLEKVDTIEKTFIFDFDAVSEIDSTGFSAITESCAIIDQQIKATCCFVNLQPGMRYQLLKHVKFPTTPVFFHSSNEVYESLSRSD